MTSDGTLTIDLAGQRRVLQQSDVLTFGRAADLVIDEENPYLHRIVGRFFFHGGSWWLENLGSFIELEVVPEGGSSLRLPPSEPESTPVVHALAPPGFSIRFESNGVSYELAGVVDQAQASLSGAPAELAASNGSSAPDASLSQDLANLLGASSAPVAASLPSGDAFMPPPMPDDVAAPEPPVAVEPSGVGAASEALPFVLSREEHELLMALAQLSFQGPGMVGTQPLPSDAELAERLGRPVAHITRTIAYLCNRLTRSGVPGLHGGGDRRAALVRHALDVGLVN